MNDLNSQIRRRSQHRFWHPLDYRYEYYSWPNIIIAKCVACETALEFKAIVPEHFVKDELSGGYTLTRQPITTKIDGKGSCLKCGNQPHFLSWPTDAYFKIEVAGGSAWAWNQEYLVLLRARVSGDRVLERQLCLKDSLYRYFLARLPKFVVVKRHRTRLLRKIDEVLSKHSPNDI